LTPQEVEAAVLPHAHLDHVGRLPRLFREGFRGPVYGTKATALLMRIVLEDALKVMEEPFFAQEDLEAALEHAEPLEYGVWLRLGDLTLSLGQAGHLPGSGFVVAHGEGKTRRPWSTAGIWATATRWSSPTPPLPLKRTWSSRKAPTGTSPTGPTGRRWRSFWPFWKGPWAKGGRSTSPPSP